MGVEWLTENQFYSILYHLRNEWTLFFDVAIDPFMFYYDRTRINKITGYDSENNVNGPLIRNSPSSAIYSIFRKKIKMNDRKEWFVSQENRFIPNDIKDILFNQETKILINEMNDHKRIISIDVFSVHNDKLKTTNGKYVINIMHWYDTSLYNSNGINEIAYCADENLNILGNSITGEMQEFFNDYRRIELNYDERFKDWIKNKNHLIDFFGNIKSNDVFMEFKMKFGERE